MNDLVRQIAVLSVLWAVCEMLLPDGKQQQMVRMTASILIMAALMTTVRGWLGDMPPAQAAMTVRVQQSAQDIYRRTALTAMANQLEKWCVNTARRAGYPADAAVYFIPDGSLSHVELRLQPSATALVSPGELQSTLAQQLGVPENCIRLSVEEK